MMLLLIILNKLFWTSKYLSGVLPHMRSQSSGLIVNITSIAGHTGLPFRGIYSASKSALSIITESLRMEVKKFGIDVCSVAPGDFATDIASRRYHSPIIKIPPTKNILII